VSIREIQRRTGLHRETIRRALRSQEPPRYRRRRRPSKLDPDRDEVQRLLREEPRLPGTRMLELLRQAGYGGGKSILDEYLRELRPLFLPRPRTYQRTQYRPGALCQFDLWEPSAEIPVGCGQLRRGYVVVCCLPYSRVGAGALVFSKQAPDLLDGKRGDRSVAPPRSQARRTALSAPSEAGAGPKTRKSGRTGRSTALPGPRPDPTASGLRPDHVPKGVSFKPAEEGQF
jgi:hypothetical protein